MVFESSAVDYFPDPKSSDYYARVNLIDTLEKKGCHSAEMFMLYSLGLVDEDVSFNIEASIEFCPGCYIVHRQIKKEIDDLSDSDVKLLQWYLQKSLADVPLVADKERCYDGMEIYEFYNGRTDEEVIPFSINYSA